MDHLLELARAILPAIRSESLGSRPIGLRQIREASDEALSAFRDRRLREVQPGIDAVPGPPGREAAIRQFPSTLAAANDVLALETVADVLARNPTLVGPALAAAGGEDATFRPAFISCLLDTVIEIAEATYRHRGTWDRIVWVVWRQFAAREYVALLRDRHQQVATLLAGTRSWAAIAERLVTSPPPDLPGGTAATMSIAGAGDLARMAKQATTACADAVRRATRGLFDEEGEWQRVCDLLRSDRPERDEFVRLLGDELLRDLTLVHRLVEVAGAAVPFEIALEAEHLEIQASRRRRSPQLTCQVAERYGPRAAAALDTFGLALSGGGVRSATFNLGVLQGLANLGLLSQLDYLSTVSGGGYVGAWLTAWIKRAAVPPAGGSPLAGVRVLEARLRQEPTPRPDEPGARPLRFLREYSNYLTPRVGFFSADTWTLVAIWLRNTLLNQSVLVLVLAALLLVPWGTGLLFAGPPGNGSASDLFMHCPRLMAAVSVLYLIAAFVSGTQLARFHLPPAQRAQACEAMLGQSGVLQRIVAPALLASVALAAGLFLARESFEHADFRSRVFLELLALFFVCIMLAALRGKYHACFTADRVSGRLRTGTRVRLMIWAAFIIVLAALVASAAGAALLVQGARVAARYAPDLLGAEVSWHWVVLGPPAVIGAVSIMIVINIGIMGRNLFDEHREWWSRVGAWLTIINLGWLAVFGLAIYGPLAIEMAWRASLRWVVATGGVLWAAWTAAGVLLGNGDKTSGVGKLLERARVREWVTILAPYVFIAGLLGLVSAGALLAVTGRFPHEFTAMGPLAPTAALRELPGLFWGPPVLLVVAFLLSCRVDVNEFSMHHFYKNRLVRCYLGASRDAAHGAVGRAPDPFTGFDAGDDVKIADLRVSPGGADGELAGAKSAEEQAPYVGPLPIVNVALNLVSGDDLAWQERKAESFTFTPLFSGYESGERRKDIPSTRLLRESFRPTPLYGYPPFGIGLGTAVAISGAAASPNMGYHTAPAAAFLMTMFNARLGWWLGNPRDRFDWLRSGPRRGLLYLLNELFGLTNDRTPFVNLSDGGHFDNLGLYELVRRRCRYIIVCDAEQDGGFTFGGLGYAIRKCRIDLGIEIELRPTRLRPDGDGGLSPFHAVLGDITYPDGEHGTLLYLKASLSGDEPADVLEYRAREPAFPHHSTLADQFFDESQFESYRKLGVHIVQSSFSVPGPPAATLRECFDVLRDYWYPSSVGIERYLHAHGADYDTLLERVRVGPGLEFLDDAFFGMAVPPPERQQVFSGALLLDFMQRLFLDLDLERDADHPHNAGWMAIFRRWKQHPSVGQAWTRARPSYGRRFRRFFDQL